jgi:hypothetical protein
MSAAKGNKYAKGNKGGRPTAYRPEFAEKAVMACELGYTDFEIAKLFNITVATLNRWKLKYKEFCASIKLSKTGADDRVERSLYARAVGYDHDAVKVFLPAGSRKPVYAPYVEHQPPDVTAAFRWLNNRRPNDWRDRREFDTTIRQSPEIEEKRKRVMDALLRIVEGEAAPLLDVTPQKVAK